MPDLIWTFLAISIVVIVAPGQDTALTIRNTLAGGRESGIATALGVSLGQAVWAVATAFGVVAFLLASEPVFAAVKLAGACYIVFLGLQSLYAAFRTGSSPRDPPGETGASGLRPIAALRQGAISNLGNPKMAIFFASLLPQFVPEGEPAFAGLILLSAIYCTLTLLWLSGYALLVAGAGRVLRRPGVRRWIEGVTGAALIAFGLKVATSER